MTQPVNIPPVSPNELARKERARSAWKRLWQRISLIGPNDLVRLLLVLLAIGAFIWLSVASWPALAPFVAGGFIAYLLFPIVNALDRVFPRPIAALITLAGFFALVYALAAAIAPALADQATRLYTNNLTPDKLQAARQGIIDYLQAQPEPLRTLVRNYLLLVSAEIQTRISGFFTQLASNNVTALLRLFNTFGALFGLLVLPFWVLGVMSGQRRFASTLRRQLPDWLEADLWAVIRIFDRVLSAFLHGQIILGIAAGTAFYFGLVVLGRLTPFQVQYPVVAGLLIGVLQLIPQLGALIGILLILILSLPAGIQFTLAMVGTYLAAQFIVSQLVSGHVSSRVINLNPVLLALLITAISQFGLIWVLLSAPILAIARDLFRYIYGRFGDPARPAGILPEEPTPAQRPAQSPLPSEAGMQPARRSRAYSPRQPTR